MHFEPGLRILVAILIAIALELACGQTPTRVTGQPLGNASLENRVPAPHPEMFEQIRDARDWRNPILIIHAKEIEIRSIYGEWRGDVEMVTNQLERLDAAAWPYGRVVLMQDSSLINGFADLPSIRRNRGVLRDSLQKLKVQVVLFPS